MVQQRLCGVGSIRKAAGLLDIILDLLPDCQVAAVGKRTSPAMVTRLFLTGRNSTLTLPRDPIPGIEATPGMGDQYDEADETAVHAGVQGAGCRAFVRRRCEPCQPCRETWRDVRAAQLEKPDREVVAQAKASTACRLLMTAPGLVRWGRWPLWRDWTIRRGLPDRAVSDLIWALRRRACSRAKWTIAGGRISTDISRVACHFTARSSDLAS